MSHPPWKSLITGPAFIAILQVIDMLRWLWFFPPILVFGGRGEADVFEDYNICVFVQEAQISRIREIQYIIVVLDCRRCKLTAATIVCMGGYVPEMESGRMGN